MSHRRLAIPTWQPAALRGLFSLGDLGRYSGGMRWPWQNELAKSIRVGPPGSVMVVVVMASVCQLGRLLILPVNPVALVGLGFTVIGGTLLIVRSPFGWFLMMFWGVSTLSSPLVFDAPWWPVLAGAFVVAALISPSARGWCLGRSVTMVGSIHPIAAERDLAARLRDFLYSFEEAVRPSRLREELVRRVPNSWLRSRNLFWFFFLANLVLLPLTGIVGRLDRNSGGSDPLVDVAYHVVSVLSTLSLLGLIVVVFLILRTVILR